MPLGNIKDRTRHINRSEHGEQNPQDQSHGETTNLICPDRIQHECRDQRCQVCVDDCHGGL